MIKITPTASSGLSAASYSVSIPTGEGIDLGKSRPIGLSQNLDGSFTVSAWAKSLDGHQFSTEVDLLQSQFDTLKSIVDHATVFEWIARFSNRTFLVVLDLLSEKMIMKFGRDYWRVNLQVTIVSDARPS